MTASAPQPHCNRRPVAFYNAGLIFAGTTFYVLMLLTVAAVRFIYDARQLDFTPGQIPDPFVMFGQSVEGLFWEAYWVWLIPATIAPLLFLASIVLLILSGVAGSHLESVRMKQRRLHARRAASKQAFNREALDSDADPAILPSPEPEAAARPLRRNDEADS